MKVVNVGCGKCPIEGAINIDNSMSVRLASHPVWVKIFKSLKLLGTESQQFICDIRNQGIIYGSATKLPLKNESVDVVYSSHMVEHLYEEDLKYFIHEAYRVLKKGGIMRMALPDLSIGIQEYLENHDADAFCIFLDMNEKHKQTVKQKLKYLLVGDRNHKWMYDSDSMKSFIEANSTFDVHVLKAGKTLITGEHGIDLSERIGNSAYLECIK